jgi:integrase
MMSVAIDHELIEKNCVSRMPKFPECSGRERYLSGEEIKRFLAALDNTPQQVSGLAIKLLLASGMRKSECLSLPWSNINLDEGFAKLDMDATKGKRARTVVLNDSALTILKELQKLRVSGNPYVFPGKTGKHITTVRKTFENCKKVAGIEQFVLHGCRHTFCSILAGSGVSLFLIQRLVGHSSASMTQRYSHLGSDTLREASEIVSNQLNIAA